MPGPSQELEVSAQLEAVTRLLAAANARVEALQITAEASQAESQTQLSAQEGTHAAAVAKLPLPAMEELPPPPSSSRRLHMPGPPVAVLARSRAERLASSVMIVGMCAWAVTTFAAWWYHVSVGDYSAYNRDATLYPCGRALQAMLLHVVVVLVVVVRAAGVCVRAGRALPSPAALTAAVLPPPSTLLSAPASCSQCARTRFAST
jgi:hypothetical protein